MDSKVQQKSSITHGDRPEEIETHPTAISKREVGGSELGNFQSNYLKGWKLQVLSFG